MAFKKISDNSNKYIENCFNIAINLIKSGYTNKLINGPISKKTFLKSKYPGMTEYFASKVGKKNQEVKLIFNKKLSVNQIKNHFPLKKIFNKITFKNFVSKFFDAYAG